jgi:hypothetical protein
MDAYRDHPMDLADASVIASAETLGTRRVFTLVRNDFGAVPTCARSFGPGAARFVSFWAITRRVREGRITGKFG